MAEEMRRYRWMFWMWRKLRTGIKVSSDPLAAALSLMGMLEGIIQATKEENEELKSFLRCLGYTMVIDEKGEVSMKYEEIRCIKPERNECPFDRSKKC